MLFYYFINVGPHKYQRCRFREPTVLLSQENQPRSRDHRQRQDDVIKFHVHEHVEYSKCVVSIIKEYGDQ